MKTGIIILEKEPLAKYCTFRIGGPAKYFAVTKNYDEILEAINFAREKNCEYRVIGGGSNILFSDDGYDGLIIKYFNSDVNVIDDVLEVGAGTPLTLAMNFSLQNNLLGLEWAGGIPGTIGGAIHNNAGAYGGEMSECVSKIKVLKDDELIELLNSDCDFGYRESRFKTDNAFDIIISATLKLRVSSDEEKSAAKEKMAMNLADRKSKSAEGPSAGSTFRNLTLSGDEIERVKHDHPELPDQYVGWKKIPSAWLIDQCELKGRKIGGAMVSERHAGKITNVGNASAADVIMLISIVKQKVRSKYNLQLMEEIEYIGF